MMKTIKAKYPGTCPHCGLPYWPGDLIVRRDSGWGHAECPPVEEGIRDALRRWWDDHAAEKARIIRANLRAGMSPEAAAEMLAPPKWVGLAIDRWADDVRAAAIIAIVDRAARMLLGRPLTAEERQGGDPWFNVIDELARRGWRYSDARRRMRARLNEATARKRARAKALLRRLALEELS